MTDQPRRITIDAPDGPTILAARHLDATEGPVQVGRTVDTATRSAINRVLAYIAKAHNSPIAPTDKPVPTCAEHDGPCFPDPTAQCPAHGEQQCAACHRNPSSCADRDYVECGFWSSTGMHWDTCSNRIRGPLTPADQPRELS